MSGLTYIFLGLDTTDTVEQDIQTSGEDSLVLGGPGHCVGFTWGGDSIGKQQAYNTTNPEVILSWILVFKPCTSMLNAKYLIFFTLRLMNSFNTNTCNKRKMSRQEFFTVLWFLSYCHKKKTGSYILIVSNAIIIKCEHVVFLPFLPRRRSSTRGQAT